MYTYMMCISTENFILIIAVSGALAGYYFYKKFKKRVIEKQQEENEAKFRKYVGNTLKQRSKSRKRNREEYEHEDDEELEEGYVDARLST